jgi:hypothetical protein
MRFVPVVGLLVVLAGCTTTTPAKSEDLELRLVIDVPGMNKDALSSKTIAWLLNTFPSSKLETQDNDSGRTIIGHGRTEFANKIGAAIPCDFTITAEIEDGRERLTFDDWIGQWGDFKSNPEPITEAGYAGEVRAKLEKLASALDSYLKTSQTRR